jgi:hypothetical protein
MENRKLYRGSLFTTIRLIHNFEARCPGKNLLPSAGILSNTHGERGLNCGKAEVEL